MTPTIRPNLWFDTQAEEAVAFYVSVFKDSRVVRVQRYTEAGPGEPGSVMFVEFELGGQPFAAVNGGPQFPFTEAVSFEVACQDQAEVDHFWSVLGEGGEEGPCGWLKDRYGLSWQVVPVALGELFDEADPARAARTMTAMQTMRKLDLAALQEAAAG